jgi:octaprenyl-diphosphate synthase
MGDWLYMTAFQTALGERSLEILDILTRLTRKMTEGEIIQMTTVGKLKITEDEYFDILRRKTAYLFESCCEVGAILGTATNEQRKALANFGLDLGTAFQLADDLLDLTADDKQLGKAAGSDLLEGKLTLALILLLEREPPLNRVSNRSCSTALMTSFHGIRSGKSCERTASLTRSALVPMSSRPRHEKILMF